MQILNSIRLYHLLLPNWVVMLLVFIDFHKFPYSQIFLPFHFVPVSFSKYSRQSVIAFIK